MSLCESERDGIQLGGSKEEFEAKYDDDVQSIYLITSGRIIDNYFGLQAEIRANAIKSAEQSQIDRLESAASSHRAQTFRYITPFGHLNCLFHGCFSSENYE